MALAATAQDGRVAGLEAQRTGIARHVRPALVDDADDAERYAHALDPQPVRTHPLRRDRADGIRERRDLLDADGHRLDARGIETQPVEHRATETGSLRRVHVACVGGKYFPGSRAQRLRRRRERRVLAIRVRERQHLGGLDRGAADRIHHFRDVSAHATTTRSSRWIISSRPR